MRFYSWVRQVLPDRQDLPGRQDRPVLRRRRRILLLLESAGGRGSRRGSGVRDRQKDDPFREIPATSFRDCFLDVEGGALGSLGEGG